MKKLSIIILVLTLSVTNIYAAGNNTETDSGSKREQRKLKQQNKILRALDILQSGKFKFIDAYSSKSRFGMYGISRLDVSDPDYEVKSTSIDTVKSTYTVIYHKLRSNGEVTATRVEYNFRTGYLEVRERWDVTGSYAIIVADNYSCIYALNEEPIK